MTYSVSPLVWIFGSAGARVIFQQRQLVRYHGVLNDRILRLRLIFWPRVVIVVRPHVVKVSAQGKAKHQGITALIAEVNVGPVGDAVNGADVKLALCSIFPAKSCE